MAFVISDRIKETSTGTGTGTLTLAGAVTGFATFAAVGNANTCTYAIIGVDANGVPTGEWETGIGTYTSSGTTLSRGVIKSSNSNALVTFSAGTKHVICTDVAGYATPLVMATTANRAIQVADQTALSSTAGNARGKAAVDLQIKRSSASHVASGQYSVISGGYYNTSSGSASVVGGGSGNIASATYAVVSGGRSNTASGLRSVICGGWANDATGSRAVVVGGYSNIVSGNYSICVGGHNNTVSSTYSTVCGGKSNTSSTNTYTTICGGLSNVATGSKAFVGGGRNNKSTGTSSVICGGGYNKSYTTYSFVGGGKYNNALTNTHSAVVGGYSNTASGQYSFVGGGQSNTASGARGVVCGGTSNVASGGRAFVGGGTSNSATGNYSMVCGGKSAKADKYGQSASASGQIAAQGDSQTSKFVLRKQTTNGTQAEIFLDNSAAQMTLSNDTTWTFWGYMVARRTDTDGDNSAWKFEGCIRRNTNAASTGLVAAVVPTQITFEGMITWTIDVTADTTNGALRIRVTGEAAKTINWVCVVNSVETTG